MSMTRLQEDLLNDFKEQKRMVVEQVELFDPLGRAMIKPAAHRLADRVFLIITEIVCYLLSAGMVAFAITMNLLRPFGSLPNVRYLHSAQDVTTLSEDEYFSIAVHAMAGLLAVLFLVIALMTRRIRLKNKALKLAGSTMRTLLSQHLKRRAAIETIEQRHFLDLPSFGGVVSAANAQSTVYEPAGDQQ
jgi:hypothetical protein